MRTIPIALSIILMIYSPATGLAMPSRIDQINLVNEQPTVSTSSDRQSADSQLGIPTGSLLPNNKVLTGLVTTIRKIEKDKLTKEEIQTIKDVMTTLMKGNQVSKMELLEAVQILKDHLEKQKEQVSDSDETSGPKRRGASLMGVTRDQQGAAASVAERMEAPVVLVPSYYMPPPPQAPLSSGIITREDGEDAATAASVVPVARMLLQQAVSAAENFLGSRVGEAEDNIKKDSLQQEIQSFDDRYQVILNKAEFELTKIDLRNPQFAKHQGLYDLLTSKELAAAITILTPPKNTHPFLKVMFYRNWNESKAYERVRVTQKTKNYKPNLAQLNRKAGFGFLGVLDAGEMHRDSLFTQMLVKRPILEK